MAFARTVRQENSQTRLAKRLALLALRAPHVLVMGLRIVQHVHGELFPVRSVEVLRVRIAQLASSQENPYNLNAGTAQLESFQWLALNVANGVLQEPIKISLDKVLANRAQFLCLAALQQELQKTVRIACVPKSSIGDLPLDA
jgi:hypothetical protein